LSCRWEKQIIGDFNNPLLPDEAGVIKIVMARPYLFLLMEDIHGKRYWKGVVRDERLSMLLKEQDSAAVEEERRGQKVVAITRCVFIEESPNILMTAKELTTNVCINRLLDKGIELIAKYNIEKPREAFLKEIWAFMIKTNGICPPGVCQLKKCLDLGGEKAPVFIDGEPLPC